MNLTTVDFHGATLVVVQGDAPETTLVAMKPVVEGMGLDWSSQLSKINRHPVLSKGIRHIAMPSNGGPQQTIMFPLSKLNLWLATVHPDKVRPDCRDAVIRYQEECADALFAHFFTKAKSASAAEVIHPSPDQVMDLSLSIRLVAEVRQTFGCKASQQMWLKIGLPTVPAMFDTTSQGNLFTYQAVGAYQAGRA